MNHTRFPARAIRAAVLALTLAGTLAGAAVLPAHSQGRKKEAAPIIIRDTEIENDIKEWIEPVVRAAQLDPAGVRIILVNDPGANAFVAGGPNIFIYTGLLLKTETASEIVGVIAHELGHIRGGHLIRGHAAIRNAAYESLLGTVLGIGAAVLTGEGGLGAAISAGARSTAMNNFLSFSRVQESSADQSALSSLETAGLSPAGLLSFMKKLESDELLPSSQQDEYARTHPLTAARVEAIQAGFDRSPFRNKPDPAPWKDQYERLKAKLTGYLKPERVAWTYGSADTSVPARYARAIAAYRQSRVNEALKLADGLIQAESGNPYFYELKAQMLLEFGRVRESVPVYKKAVGLLPDAPQIRTAYAHALIESSGGAKNAPALREAIDNLNISLRAEPRSPTAHRLLATAYGRLGEEPMAQLHLAEEALLKGDAAYAKQQARQAAEHFPKNSAPWVRAQDIIGAASRGDKNGDGGKKDEEGG